MKIEYRVRPVGRFVVTRYEETEHTGGSRVIGEYDSADLAFEVGYALAKVERKRLGWPDGDGRMIYPTHPDEQNVER